MAEQELHEWVIESGQGINVKDPETGKRYLAGVGDTISLTDRQAQNFFDVLITPEEAEARAETEKRRAAAHKAAATRAANKAAKEEAARLAAEKKAAQEATPTDPSDTPPDGDTETEPAEGEETETGTETAGE